MQRYLRSLKKKPLEALGEVSTAVPPAKIDRKEQLQDVKEQVFPHFADDDDTHRSIVTIVYNVPNDDNDNPSHSYDCLQRLTQQPPRQNDQGQQTEEQTGTIISETRTPIPYTRVQTKDLKAAAAIIRSARERGRPVLLEGFLAEHVKDYQPHQLLLLPEDVKVVSDDKSGIGSQPLRDWGSQPRRTGPVPKNWGKVASIMSEKGRQTKLWTRFMEDDMDVFREVTGHTALAAFGELVFEGCLPRSNNLIVTGSAGGQHHEAKKAGRYDEKDDDGGDSSHKPLTAAPAFESKSDAHQDQYDNLMLVTSGGKIWAVAELNDDDVVKARKTPGKLSSSLGLDAVHRGNNRTKEQHQVADLFRTIHMEPGDVLFNPAWIWHQVNSEVQTLAYSLMYPTLEQQVEEQQEQQQAKAEKQQQQKQQQQARAGKQQQQQQQKQAKVKEQQEQVEQQQGKVLMKEELEKQDIGVRRSGRNRIPSVKAMEGGLGEEWED